MLSVTASHMKAASPLRFYRQTTHSACLLAFLPVCLSVCLFICLSVYQTVCHAIFLFVRPLLPLSALCLPET